MVSIVMDVSGAKAGSGSATLDPGQKKAKRLMRLRALGTIG